MSKTEFTEQKILTKNHPRLLAVVDVGNARYLAIGRLKSEWRKNDLILAYVIESQDAILLVKTKLSRPKKTAKKKENPKTPRKRMSQITHAC